MAVGDDGAAREVIDEPAGEDGAGRSFTGPLVRVLTIQAIALFLLVLLQNRYHG
ncbi:MAG: hypothetical protein J4G12_06385 [Gemmatimonadetes bacterium]|nr:hypothetical protein [Gemmatimonadota bacterium]